MAEELVELGFEGIDRFADRYHDRVYDHLPAWKKKQQQQDEQHQQRDRQQQHDQAPHANDRQRSHKDSSAEGSRNAKSFGNDRGMSSYALDRRHDYQDDRDARYVRDESPSSRRLAAGTMVMADRGYQQRAPSPLPYGYDPRVAYPDARGRPAPSRMRSYSYSPPRSERREKSRRRHRSKSRSRSSSKDGTMKQRLGATIVGSLVGGFAGNQSRKGKKYDTAATIAGAILGGIASRELAERVGSKKEGRKEKLEDEQEAWEKKYGKDGRDGASDDDSRKSYDNDRRQGRNDDRRQSRDSRGYYDR